MIDLAAALHARPYPGRGLVVGRLASGTAFVVYFLTGRSAASRDRGLRRHGLSDVDVADTSGGPTDSLRHYRAVAQRGSWLVVGNGDHVEPLAQALSAGTPASDAWSVQTFEPDSPIFTPRIWVAWELTHGRPLLGCARRSERPGGAADQVLWLADVTQPGSGLLMSTYQGTAEQVTTSREFLDVVVREHAVAQLLELVWQELDPELRVAALVLEIQDGKATSLLRT